VDFLHRIWRSKAVLIYPIPPAPPTAVLVPWFRSNGVVRIFSDGWSSAAAAYAPAAIAGTWTQLEALVPQAIPSLTHALIVVALADQPLLAPAQRQKLWDAFGVPVFQQIVTPNGTLLAAECEAHDGLHIESAKLSLTGLAMETALCACGRKSPRVKFADSPQTLSVGAR